MGERQLPKLETRPPRAKRIVGRSQKAQRRIFTARPSKPWEACRALIVKPKKSILAVYKSLRVADKEDPKGRIPRPAGNT